MKSPSQLTLLKKQKSGYGGELLKKRKARSAGRPIDSKNSMHIVMRSSKAKGSFSLKKHTRKIQMIVDKFAAKHSIRIHSMANVGNHLHLHIKLRRRRSYFPFIRAISSAIAIAATGASKLKPLRSLIGGKFWDYRPYTRVIRGLKGFLNIEDYIQINQWEGFGADRLNARLLVKNGKYLESG